MEESEIVESLLKNKWTSELSFASTIKHGSEDIINAILLHNKWGFSTFHLACLKNDLATVESMIKTGYTVHNIVSFKCPNWRGYTPLHFAVIYNNPKIVEVLLSHEADINFRDAENITPLEYAASRRIEPVIKCILTSLVTKNLSVINDFGLTMLHIASVLRDSSVIKDLLQHKKDNKPDLNAPVDSKATLWSNFAPLHIAARYNRLEPAKLLLSHGANVTASFDDFDATPLHVAHRYGNKKMMDLILSTHDGTSDPINGHGISHLHIACSRRDPGVVSRLLSHGADPCRRVHERSSHTWSSLSALEIALSRNRARIVRLLAREAGADLRGGLRAALDRKLLGPRSAKMLDRLLGEGALREPNVALSYACRKGYAGLARTLLRHGADVEHRSADSTPLEQAIVFKQERIVEILLEAGARPTGNALDQLVTLPIFRKGVTKLELERYYDKVLSWFIKAGMDADEINRALRRGTVNTLIVQVLLRHGADVNAVGKNGKTALWHFFGGSSCFGDNLATYAIFRNHLLKLRIIGLPISMENESLFKSVQKRYEKGYMSIQGTRINGFSNQCEEECKKLKMAKLNKYTSLHDVIFKDLNDMAMLVKNHSLEQMLASDDFEKRFPNYGYLLKAQFRRGTLRIPLLESAQEAFYCITERRLPDSCLMEIFKYLSDQNLRDLAQAKSVAVPQQEE